EQHDREQPGEQRAKREHGPTLALRPPPGKGGNQRRERGAGTDFGSGSEPRNPSAQITACCQHSYRSPVSSSGVSGKSPRSKSSTEARISPSTPECSSSALR